MNFNSIPYLLFIPIVFLCLYPVADRFRWLVLLAASLYFYATLGHLYLIAALLLVAVVTWGCGLLLARSRSERGKNALFGSGVSANLLVLIGLKYLPFLERNLNALLANCGVHLAVPEGKALVSIGVSYFVFQAISYLIDLDMETEEPERHLGYFTLYLAFFPKLMQGPIERAGDLLPQLRSASGFDQQNFRAGALQFGWGLFKKAVLADRLAFYVNAVYGDVHAYSGLPLLVATYIYAFQLYYDFSGYTDMALGTARMLNIRLTQNFNAPYLARSVADFWRRWHISFSRWILDYLFKPLQMRLRYWKSLGTAVALLVAFLASGIWHGASWCFVIWGGPARRLSGRFRAMAAVAQEALPAAGAGKVEGAADLADGGDLQPGLLCLDLLSRGHGRRCLVRGQASVRRRFRRGRAPGGARHHRSGDSRRVHAGDLAGGPGEGAHLVGKGFLRGSGGAAPGRLSLPGGGGASF